MWPLWDDKSENHNNVSRSKYNVVLSTDESEKPFVETLECDYQRDCIPLYKNLEAEKFDEVLKFLDTGYWSGCFFADPVPPAAQARTWITRFDESGKDKKVVWSQLTLHLAIVIQAPLTIIKRLVELYPQSVRCTDDQRMLPLHLALRHGGNFEVVALLLKQFPEAVNVRGGKGDGRLPVEYALRGPNKALGDILETFVERSKAKATKTAAKNHAKELEILQAKLQAKEYELSNVKTRLDVLDEEKDAMERELAEKRNELKQSMESLEEMKRKEEEMTKKEEEKLATAAAAKKELEDQKDREAAAAEVESTKSHVSTATSVEEERPEVLNKHINALEEHQSVLLKRIEEIERKVEANKTESKVRAEESGLLEELGSMLDLSIQELRERVNTMPSSTKDEDEDGNNKGKSEHEKSKDEAEAAEEEETEEQFETEEDTSDEYQSDIMKRIDEMEQMVEMKRSESKAFEEENDDIVDQIGSSELEKIGSELDASVQELKQRVQAAASTQSNDEVVAKEENEETAELIHQTTTTDSETPSQRDVEAVHSAKSQESREAADAPLEEQTSADVELSPSEESYNSKNSKNGKTSGGRRGKASIQVLMRRVREVTRKIKSKGSSQLPLNALPETEEVDEEEEQREHQQQQPPKAEESKVEEVKKEESEEKLPEMQMDALGEEPLDAQDEVEEQSPEPVQEEVEEEAPEEQQIEVGTSEDAPVPLSAAETTSDIRDDMETDGANNTEDTANPNGRADDEEEVESVLLAEVRVGPEVEGSGHAEDLEVVVADNTFNDGGGKGGSSAYSTYGQSADYSVAETDASALSEIQSLKSEVERLRLELKSKYSKQQARQLKKTKNMKDHLRSKFPFLRGKRDTPLSYAPTI
ncbi:hypothetical protein ACA910_021527 [Epithemia clementina (nom. ined.)]